MVARSWPVRAPGAEPGPSKDLGEALVSLLLDRRGLSVRSCKLVFLISDHTGAALNKPAEGPCCRVRKWALIMRAIK